jgi:hypothetical protein
MQGTLTLNGVGDLVLWYEFEPSSSKSDVEFYILPSSLTISSNRELQVDVDCNLNHQEAHDRGYTVDQGEWRNVEITSWFFVKEVTDKDGFIFIEARKGMVDDDDAPGDCCQFTSYGVKIFWNNADADKKGKFQFFKSQMGGGTVELDEQSAISAGPEFSTFYQHWFGVKFCVYNKTPTEVRIELWLSIANITRNPTLPENNRWVKVGDIGDFPGRGWGEWGKECDAETKDFPITWAAPLILFGWKKTGQVVRFINTSFREIDINGSFGEDPIPDPDPLPDPGIPDPDPVDPGTPPPAPPDATPPQFPTTMTKRLTLRREIINNRLCSCDGVSTDVPVPPGGGGGGSGGGGTGSLITLYNVALNTSGFARLALVANSTTNYLRFGQGVTQTSSSWINKSINRVEITIADEGNPTGGTGGGVHCRIRKASDDSIAATLSPVASETEIVAAGKVFVFENLTNTYKMAFNDKLLFEYDGGNSTNYVKIFRTQQPVTTGTKIVFQTNAQDAGEYLDEPSLDICARVYTLTP